jgi:hypothetical protein
MKTVQDCSHWREAIRAWVGEGAAGEQAARIQSHLAACADCRRYAGELRAAAAGLRWLADRPVDPSPDFRARWTRAVEEAAQPRSFGETAAALADWWRGLLLRNLRPALAIAPLWILVLLFRLSAPEVSPAPQTTAARSPVEIFRALKLSEQLLAAAPEQPIPARVAPHDPHSAQPRSEGLAPEPTAQVPHLPDLTYVAYLTFPPQPLRAAPPVV